MKKHAAALALLVVTSSPTVPLARSTAPFAAKVVAVADGDTITVLRGKRRVKVRLHGVDCPEKGQPFGKKAKRLTAYRVSGLVVEVRPITKDRNHRIVARVMYPTRTHRSPRNRSLPHRVVTRYRSLGKALLRAGLAWWARRYAPNDKKLAALEAKARKAKRGLWADRSPVAPWDWRRGKRAAQPLGVLKGTMVGDVRGTAAVDVSHPVRANAKSKVYHWFSCPDLVKCKRCSAAFKTPLQAESAGYRPHRRCVKAVPTGCYDRCRRRSSMQSIGWKAIEAQCRSHCARN